MVRSDASDLPPHSSQCSLNAFSNSASHCFISSSDMSGRGKRSLGIGGSRPERAVDGCSVGMPVIFRDEIDTWIGRCTTKTMKM